MGRRITDLSELLDLFEDFESSMFRLETLQVYDVEYERARYDAFLTGDSIDLTPGPWQDMIRRHRAAERAVERVHVVLEPLSDYLRYELATAYQRNAAAGEHVGILPTDPGQWPDRIPDRDYWLFDDRTLWIMDYTQQGQFVVAEQVDDSSAVHTAVTGKYAALRDATPLAEYLPARRIPPTGMP